jgi:hypothetical protein
MSVLPFRFSLIGGMTACAANRRTFKDFSLKGPTPTAGLSIARIKRYRAGCKPQMLICGMSAAMMLVPCPHGRFAGFGQGLAITEIRDL